MLAKEETDITPEHADKCEDILRRAGQPAPIVHVDAQDFSTSHAEWAFGLHAENSAAALRRLADDIEANNVVLSKVKQENVAESADFSMTTLTLAYARRHHKENA